MPFYVECLQCSFEEQVEEIDAALYATEPHEEDYPDHIVEFERIDDE